MRKRLAILPFVLFVCIIGFAQPVIQSFSPVSGAAGTVVIIKGSGFSTTIAGNIVFFGAAKAVISGTTDTTIAAIVPAGATYQPITVTNNNLTAYAAQPFIVTFGTGGTGPFTSASFLPKSDLTTGVYPHSVVFADFNLDGKTDLLVPKGSSGTVSVLTNTTTSGNISFGTSLELTVTGNNHEGAAAGDLDGDGKVDFVITNSISSNSVSVFRNTTTGNTTSFAARADFAVVNGPYAVAIGDINGDGKPDLAIANNGADKISVYKNTSTPGNISFAAKIDLVAGTNPYSVVITDLDSDGKPELILTTQSTGSALSVMKNSSCREYFF